MQSAAATSTAWWRGAAIYQIYPRSFSDSNGDGIGDLPGITEKLDYVRDLGVDGIWLSPFFTSPMRDFGYDVADYCGVDPVFGTLRDFDVLVERAHSLGLRAGALEADRERHRKTSGERRADHLLRVTARLTFEARP